MTKHVVRYCFLAIGLMGLCGMVQAAAIEKRSFDIAGLKELLVRNGAGNIHVSATTGGSAEITAEKIKFGSGCRLDVEKKGASLEAIVRGNDCEVNLTVSVPQATDVELKAGAGNLTIDKLKGRVKFAVGSGEVKIMSEVTKLEGRTGSGTVIANSVAGDAELSTGSGAIKLVYAGGAANSEFEVKTGTGDIEVSVPKGIAVQSDFRSGTGKLVNSVTTSTGNLLKITGRSGTGDLKINTL